MKGTNDAWNMCIHNYIVNGRLFRAKLVKGDNSGNYKIINNECEFPRCCIPKTTEHILMKITLHLYQA